MFRFLMHIQRLPRQKEKSGDIGEQGEETDCRHPWMEALFEQYQ